MLYGQIERELAEIEPWLLCHQTKIPTSIEPECDIGDHYDEALLYQVVSRMNSSNRPDSTKITARSFCQLFFYYLSLLMGRRKIATPPMQRVESSDDYL